MRKTKTLILIFTTLLFTAFLSCNKTDDASGDNTDYRQEMRDFVMSISRYAKSINSNFLIIPQNGQELVTANGKGDGAPQAEYLASMDATGREDMFYGYVKDDEETPAEDRQFLLNLCQVCEQHGVEVLSTDYCSTPGKMDNSYALNEQYGFISFAAPERSLDVIPVYPEKPFNENDSDITQISQAKNFLYLINSENYTEKQDFVKAVSATNYDLIIIDLFHNEAPFTTDEISALKTKKSGSRRLVVCYMSIGEAEDYRYYWQPDWKPGNPSWLEKENPDWEGNYKVKYWDKGWQGIIFGNDGSYLNKILDVGFDGVYLDIIDAFEYFEESRKK
ncbi:MAG: hypothetical protein GXO86_01565 [Chlorobi bacterium]|nr:hypothetical protein [Chlorobiota bacterium]